VPNGNGATGDEPAATGRDDIADSAPEGPDTITDADATPAGAPRSPERMRTMLSSFQDGMNLGRRQARTVFDAVPVNDGPEPHGAAEANGDRDAGAFDADTTHRSGTVDDTRNHDADTPAETENLSELHRDRGTDTDGARPDPGRPHR